jgi:glycosyltransferase involved in cell wall biosynthesis
MRAAESPLLLLLAAQSLTASGPDKVVVRLHDALREQGCVVRVAYPAGSAAAEVVAHLGEDALELRTGRLRAAQRYPVLSLARAIRRVRPDAVLTTARMDLTAALGRSRWPHATAWIARPANDIAANTDVPAGSERRLRMANAILRRLLRRADAIVCQSTPIYAQLCRWGIPEERLQIVANGIEAPTTTRATPATWPPRRLLAVGRLVHQKGFDLLLDSLSMSELPDGWSLRVCGSGPDHAALVSQAQRLNLPVEFAGQCDDIDAEYQSADAVLAPSRYEGFSNVVLEALAHGTPVVANRPVAGVVEAIEDGRNGWLSEEPTSAAFGAALVRMRSEPLRLDSPAIAADAVSRLAIARTAEAYCDVFRRAAERRQS